jgi:hypothetical protein
MALKPCLVCGRPSQGSRCARHTIRNGSSRAWRGLRAEIMLRDGRQCVSCGAMSGLEVHHIVPLAEGGRNVPTTSKPLPDMPQAPARRSCGGLTLPPPARYSRSPAA